MARSPTLTLGKACLPPAETGESEGFTLEVAFNVPEEGGGSPEEGGGGSGWR